MPAKTRNRDAEKMTAEEWETLVPDEAKNYWEHLNKVKEEKKTHLAEAWEEVSRLDKERAAVRWRIAGLERRASEACSAEAEGARWLQKAYKPKAKFQAKFKKPKTQHRKQEKEAGELSC
jgi:hypothetical protein